MYISNHIKIFQMSHHYGGENGWNLWKDLCRSALTICEYSWLSVQEPLHNLIVTTQIAKLMILKIVQVILNYSQAASLFMTSIIQLCTVLRIYLNLIYTKSYLWVNRLNTRTFYQRVCHELAIERDYQSEGFMINFDLLLATTITT